MASSNEIDDPTREYPEVDDQVATRPDAAPADPDEEPRPGLGGFARVVIFTGVVFALIVGMCLGLRALNVLPSFDNPFSDKTTDRSQPVLLQSMRDLSRYVAADGTFQVIVDLQENKENIPDFLVNKRTLFVGSGTVEEYVDFGSLTEGAIKVNNADKSVEIELPAPQQGQPALLRDAFSKDPNQQQRVYQLAQQRITEAANGSGLDQRARDNTEKMLSGLLTSLGYTSVKVTFASP